MAYGLAVLMPAVVGWTERRLRRHRLESGASAAPLRQQDEFGARVDQDAIRLQIDRARAGDVDALGGIFAAFRPDVVRLCTRMLGPDEAEDSANETFQRAQHRLEGYDASQPFRRWLMAIAAHHCIDRLRRRNVETRLFAADESDVDDLAPNSEGARSALEELVQTRRQSAVRDAIDALPERYRAPLVLRYFADLDYDAIAAELDITRSQVASSLYRAKQHLRSALRNQQESSP